MVHLVLLLVISVLSKPKKNFGSRVQTHCDRVEYQTGSFPFPAELAAQLGFFVFLIPSICES